MQLLVGVLLLPVSRHDQRHAQIVLISCANFSAFVQFAADRDAVAGAGSGPLLLAANAAHCEQLRPQLVELVRLLWLVRVCVQLGSAYSERGAQRHPVFI